MKTLAILYAASLTEYAFKSVFDGKSAFQKAVEWAQSIKEVESIIILAKDDTIQIPESSVPINLCTDDEWTTSKLLSTLSQKAQGYSYAVFGWADCPFYNKEITNSLYETHCHYAAEYTFAEGYAGGLSPEVLSVGTINLLAEIAKDNTSSVNRGSIFSVLKKDINSFEVETVIAEQDIRYLRLNLACQTRRDFMLCTRMHNLLKENPSMSVADIALSEKLAAPILKTLPAFYNIQISEKCMGTCTFCPYPQALQEKKGISPCQSTLFMEKETFTKTISKIADYSHDAVICLSLWGDPLYHPDFCNFIDIILKYPHLSILIETTGEMVTSDFVQKIKTVVDKNAKRHNEYGTINWIVSLDSIDAQMYTQLHGSDHYHSALNAYEVLSQAFGQSVYPQFLRLQENECQLEQFYRTWKEKTDNVIVQKYNWFCGGLADKKVADLRPIERNPCWHLRRDMHILIDGSVPLCKEYVLEPSCGNAFSDSLETIWDKITVKLEEHLTSKYKGLCENCDEYYTFNF
ncbi:MAG: spiro-SPASM protein [Treponemataceae bacterium]